MCREQNVSFYLVGGAVRDLLRGERHLDLDFTLEGDVVPLAQALGRSAGARAVLHPRFDTATIRGEGYELDLTHARRETYPRPGALPEVTPAGIEADLARRDFTVNALALRLTEPAGELIDPFGGRDDLQNGLVRVLHEASFRDDATRLLRAARYAARLNARIEAQTKAWLRRDLAYCDTVSGARLRAELERLFEDDAAAVVGTLLARDLGLLAAIHPALGLANEVAERWRQALTAQPHPARDESGFCLLLVDIDAATAESLATRLHLTGRQRKTLADFVDVSSVADRLAGASTPAEVVALLEGHSPAASWALGLRNGGRIADNCRRYLEHWRRVRPHLRGDDLIAMGIQPGPSLGELLGRLKLARLNGTVESREGEIELVRGWSQAADPLPAADR
jgi:tRNA nucleotidyltransferase (CCA-adding enzyme)